jgi:hypothetical protein
MYGGMSVEVGNVLLEVSIYASGVISLLSRRWRREMVNDYGQMLERH